MPVRHRGPLALGVLSLLVTAGASVAAMYRHEPEIGLRTGRAPEAQELFLELESGTAPPIDSTTSSAPSPTTTAAVAPRTAPTTAARTAAGEPVGCVPGTYVEQNDSCRWKPVTISGRVTDTAGRPLAGVCVESSWLPERVSTRTDAQGRYLLEVSQGGVFLQAQACADTRAEFGWVPTVAGTGPIEPGEAGTTNIVLTERGGVFGRAVDEAGQPVAGVCVAGATAPTDAAGGFAIPSLDPGEQQIAFAYPQSCPFMGLTHENPVVTVRSGEWVGPVTIVAAFGALTPP